MDRVVPIDKPSGLTSHDVVSRLRRSTGVPRIGHAGTLDPSATGVLVILVGKATRLSQFLMNTRKEYRGRMVLGRTTDTQDMEGVVTGERPVEGIDEQSIRKIFEEFVGEIEQVPPMTSAIKRDGRPLYELARKGIVVEREPRRITVERLALLSYRPPDIEFELTCSKGTYVRTLAADVGDRLGPGAHLGQLTRTRVGTFGVDDALPLEEAQRLGRDLERAGLSLFEALAPWPEVLLTEEDSEKVMFGGPVRLDRASFTALTGEHVRLTRDGSTLLAVGRVGDSDGSGGVDVRPVKVFETL